MKPRRRCYPGENDFSKNPTPRSDYKGLAYKGFFKPSTEAL